MANRLAYEVTHQIDIAEVAYQRLCLVKQSVPTKHADSLLTKHPKDTFFMLLKDNIAVNVLNLTSSKLVYCRESPNFRYTFPANKEHKMAFETDVLFLATKRTSTVVR
jgi:hypothetical protein